VWTYPLSPLLQRARVDTPPDGLAFRAQDVLRQLGYAEASRRTAYGFDWGAANFVLVAEQYGPARRDALLATHQPAVIRFWYRQHQQEFWADSFLLPDGANGVITYNSPANVEPGMIRLALDMKGRLTALEARPVAGAPPHSEVPDWQQLFSLAGLDPARFAPTEAQYVPPMAVDSRLAWTGAFDADRSERVRLEAAAWNGRVVYVNVTGDWETEPNPSPLAGAQLARGPGARTGVGRGGCGGKAESWIRPWRPEGGCQNRCRRLHSSDGRVGSFRRPCQKLLGNSPDRRGP
jgi:hypothetical protein